MTKFSTSKTLAIFIASVLLLPLITIASSIFTPDTQTWQHLLDTVFTDYVINSIVLAMCSAIGAILLGTSTAYLITRYKLPAQLFLQISLLLPLAMPAYIIAYTYTGMFEHSSVIHQFLREFFGQSEQTRILPNIRHLFGAICMLSLVLYPYVFILARAAFQQQHPSLREVSKLAGVSSFRHFIFVELPLARPAILTGAALVMMEALADYGTVAYFGVNTFSTGIYRTWFGMGNRNVASQLSSLLCVFVFLVLVLEKYARKDGRRYVTNQSMTTQLRSLSVVKRVCAFIFCLLIPLVAFYIPLFQLGWWAFFVAEINTQGFVELIKNTFLVAFLSASLLVVLAVFYSSLARQNRSQVWHKLNQILCLGYALPGIVIAVGVIVVAGTFDRQLNYATRYLFDYTPGLVLSGGVGILVFAYSVRYLSVALQNTETGLARVSKQMDEAALSLNPSRWRLFTGIHFPLLRASLLSAMLLVFVDVLKELPATLVLRPFNFNTLAVRAYELATDERLIDAALPALAIVLVGLLPVCLLIYQLQRSSK
ncbi:ABC transporter permease [Glaciecola sp. 1036]|uniref:ABC transporter permease n=1 Tax=Alteromonadaceae TaxID=72275 RepID=UPI003CFE85B7